MSEGKKPAFPLMPSHTNPKDVVEEFGGLTKREYLAMKVYVRYVDLTRLGDCEDWAKRACQAADIFFEALSQGEGEE